MKSESKSTTVFDITIRLLILLLIIAACLVMMYPFISIILWSLILGMALFPLHKKVTSWMGGRNKLASFIIILVLLAIIFIPTWLLIDSLFDQVKELKATYESGKLTIPAPTEKVKEWPIIGEKLYETWQSASVNLETTIVKYKDQLAGLGSKLVKGVMGAAGGAVQIMVALIIAGILLTIGSIGESIRKFFRKVAGDRGDEFADLTVATVGNVVKGIIGVALILGLLHGILFMIAGIPYAGIWSLLVFVLGILQLPVIFVTLPIIIYIFAIKSTGIAIMWTLLLLVAGLSDNVLKPILLGKGAPVPMLVIFIGVIGGFIFSGFIGLFTGAIIMSIGYKLFVTWINTTPDDQQ